MHALRGPPQGTCGLRVRACRGGYVREAQRGLPPGPHVPYVLGTRASLGRTVYAPRTVAPSQVVTAAPPHVENLSLCPRTVAEVEAVIAGGAWPPERDEAPELFRQWCRPNPEVRGGGMERVELRAAVH